MLGLKQALPNGLGTPQVPVLIQWKSDSLETGTAGVQW